MIRLQIKKNIPINPKQGFLATALRKFYTDLPNTKHNSPEFKNALKFVKRWHEKVCQMTYPKVISLLKRDFVKVEQ